MKEMLSAECLLRPMSCQWQPHHSTQQHVQEEPKGSSSGFHAPSLMPVISWALRYEARPAENGADIGRLLWGFACQQGPDRHPPEVWHGLEQELEVCGGCLQRPCDEGQEQCHWRCPGEAAFSCCGGPVCGEYSLLLPSEFMLFMPRSRLMCYSSVLHVALLCG